jgi:hypothetical protein
LIAKLIEEVLYYRAKEQLQHHEPVDLGQMLQSIENEFQLQKAQYHPISSLIIVRTKLQREGFDV